MREKKRHRWKGSRGLHSTPPSTGLLPPPSLLADQGEPEAYWKSVPQRDSHIDTSDTQDGLRVLDDPERSHIHEYYDTGDPEVYNNSSSHADYIPNTGNTTQDDADYELEGWEWELVSNHVVIDPNEYEFDETEPWNDYRDDDTANSNRFPGPKELSSTHLLLLLAGVFFGSVILCAVRVHA